MKKLIILRSESPAESNKKEAPVEFAAELDGCLMLFAMKFVGLISSFSSVERQKYC